jgi:hypothetical protein
MLQTSQLGGQLRHLPQFPIYPYHLTVLPFSSLLLLLLVLLLRLLLACDMFCFCLPKGQWGVQRIQCC